MKEAYAHAKSWLEQGLKEAEHMQAAEFMGDMKLLLECQGCVRSVFALGLEKLAYLQRLPYLFVQLPGDGFLPRLIYRSNHSRLSRNESEGSRRLGFRSV